MNEDTFEEIALILVRMGLIGAHFIAAIGIDLAAAIAILLVSEEIISVYRHRQTIKLIKINAIYRRKHVTK